MAKSKPFLQFGKFFIVGLVNTGLDFGILNLLMWMTKTYEGGNIAIFNTISFSVAVLNSYLLNKYWTFEDKNASKVPMQFAKFFAVAAIGWGLNTLILVSITTYVSPVFGLSRALWANFAKAAATAVVLAWNFVGYKFLVFKK